MKRAPFLLDGFPRCGSTTLTRVLNAHPEIQCCMEPFHPKLHGGQYNALAMQMGSVRTAFSLVSLRWNGLKHVWEPGTGWPFAGHPELNDELLMQAGFLLTLRRRNLLRQFVSGYVSKHIGFWVGTAAEFRARLDTAYLPALTVADTAAALANMQAAQQQRDALLLRLKTPQKLLFYEDVFENADAEEQFALCNDLFETLGYARLEEDRIRELCRSLFSATEYKWASDEVYARIPGARAVEASLAGEHTGWLFS